jgi:N-glycosylase/DNA lyase
MNETLAAYRKIKSQIDVRLKEFENVWSNGSNADVLTELIFCLCTPQSDAHKCWGAAQELKNNVKNNLQVGQILKKHGVRFHNTKALRIESAYHNWQAATKTVVESLKALSGDAITFRDTIADAVNGFGLKEASHFLRNIGMGNDICILDRHILRNLVRLGVIAEIPKLNKKKYHEVEQKMIAYAQKIKVPVAALDLVFWYNAKGEIFK